MEGYQDKIMDTICTYPYRRLCSFFASYRLCRFTRNAPSSSIVFLVVFMIFAQFSIVFSQQVDPGRSINAATIYDLQYVIGPGYRWFAAKYWRYMLSSCELLESVLNEDYTAGRLRVHYCRILENCPHSHTTQSCMVQTVVDFIRRACCVDSASESHQGRNAEEPRPPDSIPPPEIFTLEAQQTCNYQRQLTESRIYGGTSARHGEFPWLAMVVKNGRYHCSCNIIDATHCLTAAHCFDEHRPNDIYFIIAGKHLSNISEADVGQQTIRATSFVRHENYRPKNYENDIAIVETIRPFRWSQYVMPACLPRPDDPIATSCTVAGWGRINDNDNPRVLRKVQLNTYTPQQCLQTFNSTATNLNYFVNSRTLCAANGLLGGRDACKGDSGGPLMCSKATPHYAAYFVYGIVSSGNQCAVPGEPGVYMNVQSYLRWISDTILQNSAPTTVVT